MTTEFKPNIFPWREEELSQAQVVSVPSKDAANYIEDLWKGDNIRISYSFKDGQSADDFFHFLLGEIRMHQVNPQIYPDVAILLLAKNPKPTILVLENLEVMYWNKEDIDRHAECKDTRLGGFLQFVANKQHRTKAIVIANRSPWNLMTYHPNHLSITDGR